MSPLKIKRLPTTIMPSHDRVLIRPFVPGDHNRAQRILGRIMALPADEVRVRIQQVLRDFSDRHHDVEKVLLEHYELVRPLALSDSKPSKNLKMLIGAYFTQEYSLESAALFNPSIVPHPSQKDLTRNSIRFIMSLRATGEGHISSIVFREGIVDADFNVTIRKPPPLLPSHTCSPRFNSKKSFFHASCSNLTYGMISARQ